MSVKGKLIQPEIAVILAATFFLKFAGCDQFPQSPFNGTVTDRWAELLGSAQFVENILLLWV